MDADRSTILSALDTARKQAYEKQISQWQEALKSTPSEQPPSKFVPLRSVLESAACSLGVTLNDVVNACLGRSLRTGCEKKAEVITSALTVGAVSLVQTISDLWPIDPPESVYEASTKPPRPSDRSANDDDGNKETASVS